MTLDLNILNEKQLEAVTHIDGPLLILAGAGSGKTRVLTYRIAYILEQQKAAPEEILAVTFTNKAAGEMKERIAALVGHSAKLPWMGTFHSICVKILKRDGHYLGLNPSFTIYDTSDQLDVVKQAMDKLNISKKDISPNAIHSFISSAKNEFVSPEEYAGFAKGYFAEMVAAVYPEYQKILRENNAVDFDDLLVLTVQLFRRFPEMVDKYQRLFKYILVDEYQDTNHVQYIMIGLLAKLYRNICCVGDDDQSIYAFRGATIRNILNFEKDYPDAKIVKLEQNYRSTKAILDAAYEVVRKNKARTDKKLWTVNGEGEKLTVYTAENEQGEASWIVSQIKSLLEKGVEPTEVAVLYRTNAQSRALEEGFIRKGVPYRIVGGVRFYERKEVKDILAYLRVIYNPRDDNNLRRIINVPPRGLGPKSISDFFALSQSKSISGADTLLAESSEELDKKVLNFAALLKQIHRASEEMNIVELINFILDKTGYIKMLEDGTAENEARIENIKELISVASKYAELEPASGLASFLEDVSLVEADQGDNSQESVTLMTIHAAKGLEFKHVFVAGMEEGLFPHSRVFTDPNELEEERRLAYVALTRAKQRLYLVHAESRTYFGSRQSNLVSRFVEDIPHHLVERKAFAGKEDWIDSASDDSWDDSPNVAVSVQPGDRVKHEYFGVGKVVSVNNGYVKINFGPVYGVKELSQEFAPLQKL